MPSANHSLRWFNLHYIQKMILTGQQLVVFGRVKRGPRLLIDHPEFEVIENDEEILIHFRRITPIYPATEGLSQRLLRGFIFRLLEQINDSVMCCRRLKNGEDEKLRKIHFPPDKEQLRKVRDHLVLGEFFRCRCGSPRRARKIPRGSVAASKPGIAGGTIIAALPFALTNAQKRVNEVSMICRWRRR